MQSPRIFGERTPIGSRCIRFKGFSKSSSNWFPLYPFQKDDEAEEEEEEEEEQVEEEEQK